MKPFRLSITQRQLELLDWPLIQKRITQACFFEHNKLEFEAHPFLRSDCLDRELHDLEVIMAKTSELKQAFSSSLQGCPLDNDSFSQMHMLQKGKVLTPKSANLAAHLLEAFSASSRLLPAQFSSTHEEVDLKALTRSFLRPFRQFVDSTGQVHYEKHPLLSKVSQEIHHINSQLRRQIQNSLRSETYSQAIQFEQYDILDERYVIPIRSDHYQAHLGMIVSRSQSGMTLFVEPPELRELANKRMYLLAKQEEILNQIFVELSSVLTIHFQDFKKVLISVQKLDLLISKASFCEELSLTKPQISTGREIYLKSFFHPLLERPVVNDLELKNQEKGIVISGPNTGGKTVALKSLALTQLFLHSGLFVPAEMAKIPLARHVYYFSHDQQDLSQGLSSFSSEASQYIHLVENLADDSFIFIDEIFNSTSSEEASALALGLLDYIHQQNNVRVFLSTHHQFLKTVMHSNRQYLSCHVGYDFQKNVPTYKLQFDSPGSSLALSIFKKLTYGSSSKLSAIYEKAKQYLDKKQVSYEGLLERLSSQKSQLNKKIDEVNRLKNELKHQKKSSEGILYLEREKRKEEFERQLERIYDDVKQWVYNFQEELRESQKTKKAIDKLDRQKKKQLSKLAPKNESGPLEIRESSQALSLEEVKVGQQYFCTLTNSNVSASQVDTRKSKVQVKNKGMSIWVPLHSLSHSTGPKTASREVQVTVSKSEIGQVEVDGRGMRLEEFQRHVLPALDQLLCGDLPYLSIIHGHGDGVLKKWLRTHLKKNDADFEWSPDEGNDGSTSIKVRH